MWKASVVQSMYRTPTQLIQVTEERCKIRADVGHGM